MSTTGSDATARMGSQPIVTDDVLNALETYRKKDTNKSEFVSASAVCTAPNLHFQVIVRFKGVGNAPIMKQNMYKISAQNRFQAVIQFLRKELGWPAGEPLVRRLPSGMCLSSFQPDLRHSSFISTPRSRPPQMTLFSTSTRQAFVLPLYML